jgi:hypothetical protein
MRLIAAALNECLKQQALFRATLPVSGGGRLTRIDQSTEQSLDG